jgi:hypothetical protein
MKNKTMTPFTHREDQIIKQCLDSNIGRPFDAIKKASTLLGRSYNSVYSRYYAKNKFKPEIKVIMSPIQEIFFKRDMLSKAKFDVWMELNRERLLREENERERLLDSRNGAGMGPNIEGDSKKCLHGKINDIPQPAIRNGQQSPPK